MLLEEVVGAAGAEDGEDKVEVGTPGSVFGVGKEEASLVGAAGHNSPAEDASRLFCMNVAMNILMFKSLRKGAAQSNQSPIHDEAQSRKENE